MLCFCRVLYSFSKHFKLTAILLHDHTPRVKFSPCPFYLIWKLRHREVRSPRSSELSRVVVGLETGSCNTGFQDFSRILLGSHLRWEMESITRVLFSHIVRRYSPAKEGNIPFPCTMIWEKLPVFHCACFQMTFDLAAKTFSCCWLCSPSFNLIHLGPSGSCLGKGPSGSAQYIPLSSKGKELHLQNKETSKRALARSQLAVFESSTWSKHWHTCLLLIISQMLLHIFLLLPIAMNPLNQHADPIFNQSFNMQAPYIQLLSTYPVPSALWNKKMKVDRPAPKPASLQEKTLIKGCMELLENSVLYRGETELSALKY